MEKSRCVVNSGMPFEIPKIMPVPTHINRNDVRQQVLNIANKYKLRLTPVEFEELVDMYIQKYMKNIDLTSLLKLTENIQNRV